MNLPQNTPAPQPISRLRWACRRGMLELDVLLGNFLNEAYPALSEQQQLVFTDFLNHPDPELMAWIMGRETPPTEALAQMARAIHTHATNRL